ncbi:MAG: PQQ-binding-like beta-propeller repeat protein [Roseibacillus sp.]|jgi:outer membrane protein assembly factor BamB|nr:PQQ-binding-like beta-propeller repeat protein [Roseibacillus sp.]
MNTRIILATALIGGAISAQGQDWRSWRGDPNGRGAAPKAQTVTKFSDDENLVWKTELPGPGNSTPIISGEKLIVTCGIDGKDAVVAYSLQGKELWRSVLGKETAGKGGNRNKGTGSNSSVVTDGRGIFAYFKSGRVAALTMGGKKVWELNLHEKYGEDTLWWDQGSSPVLAGGLLVVAVMQTEGNSYLVGLDKKTSKEVWKTERQFDVAPESGDSYTTPLVMTIDGQETIVTWGADHLTGHDPKSGKQIWFCGGFNPNRTKFWRVISSPAATDGIVALSYARGLQTGAIRAGGKGDISKTAWLWKNDEVGADAASPVAHDGKFFVLNDNGKKRGLITCLDAVTGKALWDQKLPKAPQIYYSSPLLAGDNLYIARVDGTIFCGTVTKDGLTNLTENKLEDNLYASLVAIGNKLYVRGRKNLYCFGK